MKYIVRNQNILGGSSTIAGTRVPVQRVIKLVTELGYEEKNIKKEFPGISIKTIRGVFGELMNKGIASI